ncbi:phage tail protein I [Lysobacter capsici]|uniref:phage tail protein I n=1 Tax=Lysobacter capsici TaxID=435897 RepID=UPI00177EA1F4|nr:phage tail protein I [Lysobacter capsici]UOF16460.1 phage tail protein I [Lysobacter capsici]
MSSLLPPNATSLERALERASARIDDVPTPMRKLWNADTCPVELLPWLAWALSIDTWQPNWPEHVKRARLRTAMEIQRRKGTAQSVRQVVAAFGGAVQLREWWQQEPPGQPHTFEMVLTLTGEGGETATAQYVNDVIAEVSRTKPVRSHFTFTQGVQAKLPVGVVFAARVASYRRLQLQVE